MIQQRAISKKQDDNHYCACLYKYTKEMTITLKKYVAFVSADDKNKIKVGEPDCPIPTVTHGCQVLVAHNEVVQSADHDFPSLTLIPTVILSCNIPEDINGSWYTQSLIICFL